MSEAFIFRRGGGIGKAFAYIHVTYPSGSTCTATDGKKTLKAKGTGGSWSIPIPCAAEWAISCTNGKESVSKTVEITSSGQFVKTLLVYEQSIDFFVSAFKIANAGTYGASEYKDADVTFSTVGYATLVVAYRTGGYSTVGGASAYISLLDSANKQLAGSGNLAYHNDGATWECDISAIDVENAHIRVSVSASGGSNGYTNVSIAATNALLN